MSASSIAFEYCQRLVHRIAEHHKTRHNRRKTTVKDSGAICESLENRILLSGDQLVTFVDDSWATVVLGEDPDGDGGATEFGVDAFATIQEAIDATQANGTVHVADGTYDENISITSNLTLISDNGRDVTFINGISGAGVLGTITLSNATSDVNSDVFCIVFTINAFLKSLHSKNNQNMRTDMRITRVCFVRKLFRRCLGSHSTTYVCPK